MSAFQNALLQLDDAQKIINIDREIFNKLKTPQKILQFEIPVIMDNGEAKVFSGLRVQHNNWRGPYKGGIRFHEAVDLDKLKALALWMTIKCCNSQHSDGRRKRRSKS